MIKRDLTDIDEILATAIATEWEGFAFYSALARRTSSDLGRRVFERLAKDEVEHVKVLEEVSCSYKDGCVLMTYEQARDRIEEVCEEDILELSEEARTCKETAPIFKRGVHKAERANDLEALRIGVEAERAAIGFYQAAADSAETGEARVLFEHLVDIERGHERLLQAEYDHFSANGMYFDAREFNLEMEP